ncbi:protease-4 [Prevotella sp. tc2-28]|uniref:signal peptide peptidase SppA n=1 Tax=Prevotella sp. tc2-28 TaxID=1761888 RepID=UPI0008975226|nr:signal peptide peptidase SppA [Prevotella sp. tc2-28]SEA82833.1 protease-4 [Prevotella sp. tc2-28]
MKQFLKYVLATVTGIVLVMVIMGVLGAISLVGMAAASAGNTQVNENSVFTLSLSGQLDERAANNPLSELTGQVSKNLGLDDILTAIKKAKDNEDIKGIYLEAGAFMADTPASAHAIREALLDFKKSGKWIIAYGDSYTQTTYYICSVADKLFLNPEGMVDWHGLSSSPYFVKDLLAKFGVKVQLCKVGKYKSAPEMLTADQMSEPNREQVTAYMSGVWKVMLNDVSKSRKISVDSLNAYADQFIALADQQRLVQTKMVDKLLYTDEVKGEVKKMLKIDADDDISQLTLSEMSGVKGKKKEGEQIAVYYAYGEIVDTGTGSAMDDEHSIVANTVCKDLHKLMEDDDVKAVVLRVNSPGGSAYASEQIWHAVTQLKAKKPVVVSMGGYAASGGYYISCNANYIYTEPTTLTGSIGIFGMFPDFSGLLKDKLGVKFDEVKTNKHAAFGTIARPFNDEEMALLGNYIDRGYNLFRKRVADGRKLKVEQVEEIAQGRVWLGCDALPIKLVDAIGSLGDAVKKAAELAKLKEYHTSAYPNEPSWLDALLDIAGDKSYLDEQMEATLGEYYEPFKLVKSLNRQSAIQARLPFYMTVK